MKFKKSILAFIILFTCMAKVNAEAITVTEEESAFEVVAQTTKYYKTTTILGNSEIMTIAGMGEISSITTEISEEEYMSVSNEDGISPQASVETSYKKLVSTITKLSSSQFKYSASLTWKTMPATRSYDVIGVGFYASVKILGGMLFKQHYCTSDGSCYTQNAGYYNYEGANGYGAMFHLPSGDLTSLSQDVSVIVTKTNENTTIVEQLCAADYAHAQKTVSYSMAQDFSVDTTGIILKSGYSYYDSMNTANATWKGTW